MRRSVPWLCHTGVGCVPVPAALGEPMGKLAAPRAPSAADIVRARASVANWGRPCGWAPQPATESAMGWPNRTGNLSGPSRCGPTLWAGGECRARPTPEPSAGASGSAPSNLISSAAAADPPARCCAGPLGALCAGLGWSGGRKRGGEQRDEHSGWRQSGLLPATRAKGPLLGDPRRGIGGRVGGHQGCGVGEEGVFGCNEGG